MRNSFVRSFVMRKSKVCFLQVCVAQGVKLPKTFRVLSAGRVRGQESIGWCVV